MIDIVIPVYNAKVNLRYTLASIAMQTVKDIITVYIIDDASNCNYYEIIEEYKDELSIKYYKLKENNGAGYARQFGINKSKNNYIMFIDSDDSLYNPRSVEILYNKIIEGNEYVAGNEFDERYNIIVNNDNNLHGKIYARTFIIRNKIQFINTRFHEDCYFNNLILAFAPKYDIIDDVTYFYSYNKKSISAVNYEEDFRRIETFISNFKQVMSIAIKNNCPPKIMEYLVNGKSEYLNRVYISSSEEKKDMLKKWILKYGLEKELSKVYN